MENGKLNLFIVDDNKSLVVALKQYLINKFGKDININAFYNGESCLENIDESTHMVILDHFLNGKNGLEILKLIKDKNPNTEVIMLTSNEDISLKIETFKAGAKDFVVKGPNSWNKLSSLVRHIISEPIRIIVREFGVSKYMAIFLLTFAIMGIVVFFTLHKIY